MSKAARESDRKDKIIRFLAIAVIFFTGLLGHAHYLLATLPQDFECHFPPDLSRGGTVGVNEFGKHEVYAFAHDIYQKVYRCESDCSKEFEDNVRAYGNYFTDKYRPELIAEAKRKETGNRRKVRSLTEYGIYNESKVVELGNDTWLVYLDVTEREYVGRKKTREAVIRYPLYIGKNDVDRDKNPWRLAIDGYYKDQQPKRLK